MYRVAKAMVAADGHVHYTARLHAWHRAITVHTKHMCDVQFLTWEQLSAALQG